MTTIRKASVAALTTVALGSGLTALATPDANAAVCSSKANVYCSMSWAKKAAPVAYGASGSKVTALQKALQQVNVPVKVTGKFDAQTRTAIKTYQRSRGMVATGVADGRLIAFLRAGAGGRKITATGVVARTVTTTTKTTTSAGVSSTASRAINFAYAQLGKPYVYGATGPNAYDCSGLVQAAYRAAGKSIPRTTYAQLGGLTRVSKSALKPGDIVGFYSGGHVGIYIGNGYVIHAPHTGTVVKKAALDSMPFYAAVRPTA